MLRIGVGICTGLLIAISSIWIGTVILYRFIAQDLTTSASLVSHQIHQALLNTGSRVKTLATSDEMEKYFQTDREPLLISLFQNYGAPFSKIAYLDPQGGAVVCLIHNRIPDREPAPDTGPGFQRALKAPNTLVMDGPVFDAELEQKAIRFYYNYIDYFDNPVGILQASLSIEDFSDWMDGLFRGETRHSVLLTDRANHLIYGPASETGAGPGGNGLAWAFAADGDPASEGYLGRQDVFGTPSLVAVRRVKDLEWNSYVVKSTHDVKKPLYALFGLIFLATVAALFFGEILSRRLGLKITEPIEKLTRLTSDILTDGNLDQRVNWESRDEIGELAELFNSMLGKMHSEQIRRQKRRNRELQEEVDRRKKDQKRLRAAIKEAREATRAKSEFLANMSHEIRTPMNGIIGMAELVMDTRLDRDQENLVNTINSEAESLLAILNSILDLSKIEAGKLELDIRPFNLRALFEELSTAFAISAQKKGLEFISYLPPEVPEYLIGDPGRLRQVLVNITGNAIKFTHKGEIYIKADMDENLGSEVRLRFRVNDTGIGIPEDKHRKIFESFSQADGSTTRKYGGTGLGTTISKHLVEMMGGVMGLESKPGKGSSFWFTVVMKKDIAAGQPDAARDLPRGMRVLVVDDNKNNRFVFSQYLSAMGCVPVPAHDGFAARNILCAEAAAGTPVKLVLSDYQMPGMDGFQLAREIRSLPGEIRVPVIILTSIGAIDDTEIRRKKWVAGGLPKPVRMNDLKTAILSILNHGTLYPDPGPEHEAEPPRKSPAPARKIRILLAEDYPTNQQIIVKYLSGSRFKVKLAENGQQALELFDQHAFDLVLMDIQMPVLDGYETTLRIREREGSTAAGSSPDRIPIIAMTAHAVKGYKEKCLDAGMDDYITKPLKRKELISLITKWAPGPEDDAAPLSGGEDTEDPGQSAPGPMDFAKVLEEFEDDKAFIMELLSEFLSRLEQQTGEMEKALEDSDGETLRQRAHAIKGGAANLTAMSLSRAAAALESDAKALDFESAEKHLRMVIQEFSRLESYVNSL